MSLRRQAASGVAWTAISTIATTVLQFGQLAILARLLNPGDFGLMAMVMVVVGFANAFTDMGISNAIVHRQDISRLQLSSLYWLNVFAGLVVAVFVIALSPMVAGFYQESRLIGLMGWAALIFVIIPIGQQFQMLLQKELHFQRLAQIEIISAIAGFGVSIIAAWYTQDVLALIWGQLATAAVRSVLLAAIGWKTWQPSLQFRWKEVQGFLSFGLYQMGERSINYFSWNMDKLLIGRILGSAPLGFYNVAYQLMVRPFMVINPIITKVAFPVFSSVQHDNERLRRGILKMTQVIAFTNLPIYAGLFAVADPLMALLLGQGWEPAIAVFRVLVWLGALYSLSNPIGSLLLAKGRADIGFWFNVAALLIYAIAILAGSQWGIVGIAVALLIANLALLLPADIWVRWYLIRLSPLDYLAAILPFALLSLAMMMGILLVDHWLPPDLKFLRLLSATMTGGVLYLGGVWMMQRAFLQELFMILKNRK